MKEVKSPKKPLIYYYSIILLIVLLFNLIVSPLLMKNQVTEVDYGTCMRMIAEKNIGEDPLYRQGQAAGLHDRRDGRSDADAAPV